MQEGTIVGKVSRRMNQYIVTADDGNEYTLFAIKPWEAVSADFDTAKFEAFVGKRVIATGLVETGAIYNAHLRLENEDEPEEAFDISSLQK